MNQTRIQSLIEALMNTAIGFSINFCANLLIFPHFGFNISLGANFMLGLLYTVISVVRSYCVRRWFNSKLQDMAQAAAAALAR
jgi:hypothetical protein